MIKTLTLLPLILATPIFPASSASTASTASTAATSAIPQVQYVSPYERFVLPTLVGKRDYAAVEQYIADGRNVNVTDLTNNTPLHYAALNSDPILVDMLLKAGADVNAKDNNYMTPLHLIARNQGHLDGSGDGAASTLTCGRCLLAAGANTLVRDVDEKTCADYAACYGYYGLLKWIHAYEPKNQMSPYSRNAAHESHTINQAQELQKLIAQKQIGYPTSEVEAEKDYTCQKAAENLGMDIHNVDETAVKNAIWLGVRYDDSIFKHSIVSVMWYPPGADRDTAYRIFKSLLQATKPMNLQQSLDTQPESPSASSAPSGALDYLSSQQLHSDMAAPLMIDLLDAGAKAKVEHASTVVKTYKYVWETCNYIVSPYIKLLVEAGASDKPLRSLSFGQAPLPPQAMANIQNQANEFADTGLVRRQVRKLHLAEQLAVIRSALKPYNNSFHDLAPIIHEYNGYPYRLEDQLFVPRSIEGLQLQLAVARPQWSDFRQQHGLIFGAGKFFLAWMGYGLIEARVRDVQDKFEERQAKDK